MKSLFIIAALFFTFINIKASSPNDLRLRIDLIFKGTPDSTGLTVNETFLEPCAFSQSSSSYIDNFKYGQYLYSLTDLTSGTTLYSNGFSSLFFEWQTNYQGTNKTFELGKTILLPKPTASAVLKIVSRTNNGESVLLIDTINPNNLEVKKSSSAPLPKKQHFCGNPQNKLDILILGDGYTKEELPLFINSAKAFEKALFSIEPFRNREKKINIWQICPLSSTSGISYNQRETPIGCGYNTLESDRYLYSYNNTAIANIAAKTPYDQIVILVNSNKYGGGGIYNDFAIGAAGCERAMEVLVHEFGHSFVGLGDEYAYDAPTDSTAYFDNKTEPWEPNITNMVRFDLKWEKMLIPQTPIPTPDSLSTQYPIGLYEGAGYQFKGMYRPSKDCLMRILTPYEFCPVCKKATESKIKSYTK